VRTTIVNGKVLMEDRRVVGLDEGKIIRDAKDAMRNISDNNQD